MLVFDLFLPLGVESLGKTASSLVPASDLSLNSCPWEIPVLWGPLAGACAGGGGAPGLGTV